MNSTHKRAARQDLIPPPVNPAAKAVWGCPPPTDALTAAISWTNSLPLGTRGRVVISTRDGVVVAAISGTAVRKVF